MPSPLLSINAGTAGDPADVSSGATVNGALADTTGAVFWDVSVVSTDELNAASTINATLLVNQANKTFSFTAPSALGSAAIVQSIVGTAMGLGRDANGTPQPSYTTTTKVSVLAANGLRVLAVNEELEQDPVFGWTKVVNPAIRAASGGGGGGGTVPIAFAVGTSTVSSSTLVLVGAVISRVSIDISTPYSGGATISIGISGSTSALMPTTGNDAQEAGTYTDLTVFVMGSSSAIVVTVNGLPSAGAAIVYVEYATPTT